MTTPAQHNASIAACMEFLFDPEDDGMQGIRLRRSYFNVRRSNMRNVAERMKTAHRTFPAGAYKRAGLGREYPRFYPGMTTKEYIVKFMGLNGRCAEVLAIDFDALGDRPAALYENGALDFEVIEEPIDAPEAIEALATQDVAQVLAQAVAALAISEAMQPSEARELATCEAGESEAQGVTTGSASTWAPVPQYVPPSIPTAAPSQPVPPSSRVDDGGTTPPSGGNQGATPRVAEFLGDAPAYQLPEYKARGEWSEWSGCEGENFTPTARQQVVIDAVQTALSEKLYYTSDVLARCIEILKIDAQTASMNYSMMRVEGGFVGMDCYYARNYLRAKEQRAYSLKTIEEMDIRVGDNLGILVFSDSKRTTGVTVTKVSEAGYNFTGKRGAYAVSGTASADQLKGAIERAFTTGKRKTDYPAFLAAQAKRVTPPPAVSDAENYPEAALENRRLSDEPQAVDGWEVVGGGRNVPGYASVASAKIAIGANGWKQNGAHILPFSYNDGGYPGLSPYGETRERFAVVIRRETAEELAELPEVEAIETPTPPPAEIRAVDPAVEKGSKLELIALAEELAGIEEKIKTTGQTNELYYRHSELVKAILGWAPPAVESQPMPPVVETEARDVPAWAKKWDADMVDAKLQIEAMKAERESSRLERKESKQAQDEPDTLESFSDDSKGVSQDLCDAVNAATVAQVQALTDAQFSKLYDHLENWNFHTENYLLEALRLGDSSIIADMRKIVSDQAAAGCLRGDVYERRLEVTERMRKLKNAQESAPNQATDPVKPAQAATENVAIKTPQGQQVISKSGKWSACLYTCAQGKPWMIFEVRSGAYEWSVYDNASERMQALQAMARAADAPTDTPPTGGLPCPAESAPAAPLHPPVAASTPDTPVAVSSAADAPRHPRNIVPDNGLHVVEDSFEAWTFTSGARFSFVMYLGKSAKPWKYYGYSTEAKRDDGFNRHAQEARSIGLSKANRKAESKSQAEKPHGLQVGDVVRSSWGYDQTNVNHYQIIKVIGKRTVEVRKLAEHEQSTGDMSGRVAPVHGEFVGEVMRRQVDRSGQVNILQAAYGRASKIEPLAIVHGVRCYSATNYSSWA